jgi:hypothetical protein
VLSIHRRLWTRQRNLIDRTVQGHSRQFQAYERRYRRGVRRYRAVVPHEEVVRAVAGSDLAYVGDYHTLKQAQRAFLKLLLACLERDRDVVVAVEFVQGKHQGELNRWLAGAQDDATFLRRIDYARHQVFDVWPNFKPIFDLCRARGIPMVAIDRVASGPAALPARDAYAAERIAAAVLENPGALVLVLVGQLHIAPTHLPQAVARAIAKARGPDAGGWRGRSTIVHQNAEEIYFALEREGLEHTVEAVRLGEGEYCLVNSSPVVAQQSYLDWVEGEGDLLEGAGPEQNFKAMARLIANFLEIEHPGFDEALEEVQVYTAGDLSFLPRLRDRGDFSTREIRLLERQILGRESYYLRRSKIAYLATLSVNHCAEEAAHFVRHVVSGDDDDARGLIDGFYARTLNEAFAFFGSKLVNPRRKCAHERDLRRLLARREVDAVARRAAELALSHKALERGVRGRAAGKAITAGAEVWNAVTRTLGYILGEQLYYALIRGKIGKREVREHVSDPLEEDGAALGLYFYLVGKVGRTRIPKRA